MQMNQSPIFIHSLFRSGSTYLFNVFRRSPLDYWVFQEPLHEMTAFSEEEPLRLLVGFGDAETKLNRHPRLSSGYFQELFDAWPVWKESISEEMVYRGYFATTGAEVGIPFWQSLINAAKGRPVFQECRTSSRIKAIKSALGGAHIYLWRNPWDQWWSYKINNYFNTANQLIIHADHPPAPVRLMLQDLKLAKYPQQDVGGAFAFYYDRPLTSEQSYLVFYMLWCLALLEGLNNADLLLNIDHLSESTDYQQDTNQKLSGLQIDGLDFSDCQVPQGYYSKDHQTFFAAAEARVHLWLIEGGWQQEDREKILKLRKQFQPNLQAEPANKTDPLQLIEQADRFQEMARRFETALAEKSQKLISVREESQIQLAQADENANAANELAQHAEQKTREAEHKVAQSAEQLGQALVIVHQSQAIAAQAEDRAAQAEDRAAQAEDRAAQAEDRAAQAEDRAAQAEDRAAQAEDRAAQAEDRAAQAEDRAAQADLLATQQITELSQALEALRHELHQIHQSNHHHWQLAEQRQQQINALHKSRSWRITAPLRWPVNQIHLLKQYGFKARIKAFIKKILCKLNRILLARPKLRYRLIRLSKTIGLYKTLKKIHANLHESPVSQHIEFSSEANLEQLSPRAKKIYLELKQAIERSKAGES